MYTVVILMVIGCLFFGWVYSDDFGVFNKINIRYNLINLVRILCLGIVIGGLVGTIIAMIIPVDTEFKLEYSKNIVNLQDNNGASSCLNNVIINGRMAYVFYYEENDYYVMATLPYNKVTIKYINTKKPMVEKYTEILSKKFLNNFGFWVTKPTTHNNGYYILYVPFGTIQTGYILDAK